jgi:Ser/Thr protein kinase RdoA (MazF antagonist)
MKEISYKRIAEGRTAEIYLWDEGHVLKLYREWCPPDWVEYEARIARAVYEAHVPSPAVGEIVEVDGRRGLLYEHLDGISMLRDMNARPWLLLKYARWLAELQVQINRQSIPGLPTYKDQLYRSIRHTAQLNEQLRAQALTRLAALPEGQNLCHGDYHPDNVLITSRGPVVIDWMTACSGAPWADAARTSLLFNIGAKAAGRMVSPVIRLAIGVSYRAYRKRYNTLLPDPQNQTERWLPVIAAARLNEDIVPERKALLQMVQAGI